MDNQGWRVDQKNAVDYLNAETQMPSKSFNFDMMKLPRVTSIF